VYGAYAKSSNHKLSNRKLQQHKSSEKPQELGSWNMKGMVGAIHIRHIHKMPHALMNPYPLSPPPLILGCIRWGFHEPGGLPKTSI